MSPLNPPTEVECHIEYMIGTIAPQEERYMSYMVSPIARVEDPPHPTSTRATIHQIRLHTHENSRLSPTQYYICHSTPSP